MDRGAWLLGCLQFSKMGPVWRTPRMVTLPSDLRWPKATRRESKEGKQQGRQQEKTQEPNDEGNKSNHSTVKTTWPRWWWCYWWWWWWWLNANDDDVNHDAIIYYVDMCLPVNLSPSLSSSLYLSLSIHKILESNAQVPQTCLRRCMNAGPSNMQAINMATIQTALAASSFLLAPTGLVFYYVVSHCSHVELGQLWSSHIHCYWCPYYSSLYPDCSLCLLLLIPYGWLLATVIY